MDTVWSSVFHIPPKNSVAEAISHIELCQDALSVVIAMLGRCLHSVSYILLFHFLPCNFRSALPLCRNLRHHGGRVQKFRMKMLPFGVFSCQKPGNLALFVNGTIFMPKYVNP